MPGRGLFLILTSLWVVTDCANPVNPVPPPSTVSIPEIETQVGMYTALYTIAAYNANGNDPLECSMPACACGGILDIVSGENGCTIVSVNEIDFETAATKSWSVGVTIKDSASADQTVLTPFTIEITDSDDEAPYFTVDEKAAVSLNDGDAAGTTVYQLLASEVVDPDLVTTELLYWLEGPDAKYFKLDTDRVNVNTAGPTILTAVTMDYDDPAMRELEVYLKVTDRKNEDKTLSPTQFPQLRVPITVTNLNDLPIYCYTSLARFAVNDGQSGTLARFDCVDPDRESFNPGCALVAANAAFSLASATGYSVSSHVGGCEIEYTNVEYDNTDCATSPNSYCFSLKVTDWVDGAGTINTATIEVVVEVEPYDEGGTVMSLSAGTVTFAESDGVGTCKDLATVMAFSDTEADFDHFWSFSPSDDPFIINPLTGELCLATKIDFEVHQSFDLQVNVVRESPENVWPNIPEGVTRALTVTITDANDERPEFHGLTAFFTLQDGAAPGALWDFTVTDKDTVGTVATTLVSQTPDDSLFSMAACSLSCTLNLLAAPDATTMLANSYVVAIQATDGVNTVTSYVVVDITTTNVQTPVLTATPAAASFSENLAVDSLIATITAVDTDFPSAEIGADSVYYYIRSVNSGFGADKSFISIGRRNGEVRLRRPFDIDGVADSSFSFTVSGIDNRGRGNEGTVTVSLTLTQANDNPPECPNIKEETTFVIDENNAAAVNLLDFSVCSDIDGTTWGATMTGTGFTLTGANVLQINANTLNYDSGTTVYTAVVTIAESGGTGDEAALASHDRDYTVKVIARPVNDGPPVWTTTTYTSTISQAATIGTTLTLNTALVYTEPDQTSMTTYNPHGLLAIQRTSCCEADCPFSVSNAGVIKVVRSVAGLTTCALKLRLVDRAGLSSAEATVTVTITPVNHAPVCSPKYLSLTIPADTAIGTTLVENPALSCSDEDGDTLTYSLSAASSNFEVDSAAGSLAIKAGATLEADYSTTRKYSLGIRATDGTATTTVTVAVFIQASNANAPVCVDPTDTTVDENSAVNSLIATLSCTDGDDSGTPEGQLRYSMTGGDGFFSLSSLTGQIRLVKPVDYESMDASQLTQTLYITVSDRGTPARTDEIDVTYTFTNANDNAPECSIAFETAFADAKIKDETAANTAVGKLSCYDKDASTGTPTTVTFTLDAGVTTLQLSAGTCSASAPDVPCTVDIETSVVWDFDAAAIRYEEFIVTASDSVNSDSFNALFRCTPVNEAVPVFTNAGGPFSVNEGLNINSLVATLTATDTDSNVNTHGKIVFELIEPDAYFAVGSNGQIRTRVVLDYEDAEIAANDYEVELLVKARDLASEAPSGLAYNTATVTVTINDVNDEPPYFTNAPMTVSVNEGATVTGVGTLQAVDPDTATGSLVFSEVSEVLSPSQNAVNNFVTIQSTGRIDVSTAINAEVYGAQSVLVGVRVCDTAGCARYSESYVFIKLNRVNEFVPRFALASYTFTMLETSEVGKLVGRPLVVSSVAAGSVDIGIDTNVSYAFTSAAPQEYFSINSKTGAITLKEPIDREVVDSLTFTVRATELSDTTKSADVSVTVDITDANDNSPRCNQGPVLPTQYVNEEITNYQLRDKYGTLLSITCTDADAGQLGTAGIDFSITVTSSSLLPDRSAPASPFSVSAGSNTATLSTSTVTALDWETDDTDYTITIMVKDNDGTVPCKTTYLYVPVVLLDVDEEAPTFTDPGVGASYRKTVTFADTGSIGDIVTTVISGQTSDIYDSEVYSISSITATVGTATGNEFVIVTDVDTTSGATATLDYPTEGIIYLNEELDFTQKAEVYVLEIVSTDTFVDSTRTMQTATVTVSVSDANNNPPFFDPSHYHTAFPENTAIGTLVATVTATDYDATDTLVYAIVTDACNYFDIAANVISFDASPNFEANTYCEIEVSVSDGTTTVETTVTVDITPINEFEPQDNGSPAALTVNENTLVGTVVGTVLGTESGTGDLAGTPHADLVFRIKSQTPKRYFAIGYYTGDLTLRANISAEDVATVVLEVEGCDLDYSFKIDSCFLTTTTVTITVADVNEFAPRCLPAYFTQRWSEDPTITPAGTDVIDLNTVCSDPDRSAAVLSYSFVTAPSGEFVLTGSVLETNSVLDFETTQSYYMTIEVSDGTLLTTVTVSVEVLDANDNTPTADSPVVSPASPSLAEDAAIGTFVATVSYSDDDSNYGYGLVTYSITSGDRKYFSIDPLNGEIYTAALLSFYTNAAPSVDVTACDTPNTGAPNCATPTTVTLTVTDVNNFQPLCSTPTFNFNKDDQFAAATTIGTITGCSDSDSATNGNNALKYSVVSVSPSVTGSFYMNANGPNLVYNQVLDLEVLQNDTFEISIEVSDSATGAEGELTASANLVVFLTVTDVNEEEVYFSPNVATDSITLEEDFCCTFTGNRTFVHTFTATDLDYTHADQNSEFTWTITAGNTLEKFVLEQGLNWNEARLLQVNDLDREEICVGALCTGGEFELTVEVTDVADALPTQYTSTQTLTITLSDLNDNKPLCDPSELSYGWNEGVAGDTGFMLPCNDKDELDTLTATVESANVPEALTMFSFFSGPSLTGLPVYSLQLRVNSALDYERYPSHQYILGVKVSDGQSDHDQTVSVTVNIVDVDEGQGSFITCDNIDINETSSVGATVLDVPGNGWFETSDNTLASSDPDNPYQTMTWSLTGNAGGYLNIEPTTGVIKLAKRVDREVLNSPVAIDIIVNDGTAAVTCATTYTVIDANDNLPLLDPANYAVSIVESVARNTDVILVSVTDDDDPNLPFSVVEEDQLILQSVTGDVDAFKVKACTSLTCCGVTIVSVVNNFCVSTNELFDFHTRERYKYVLAATDNASGSKRLTAFGSLTINILAENLYIPTFSPGQPRIFSVSEKTAIGSSVVQIDISDDDSSKTPFGVPKFSLDYSSDADPTAAERNFGIDETTGIIHVRYPLDYEAQTQFILIVEVHDDEDASNPTALASSTTITLNILDSNDNKPVFASKINTVSVDEDKAVGSLLTSVTATDADSGYYGLVYYQFRAINSPFCFDKLSIGERNGEVRVKSTLDYEETESFSCIVEAYDHDIAKNPFHTSSAVLNVLLIDINDNSPTLKSAPLTFTVLEKVPVGTKVGVVVPYDLDSMSTNGNGFRFTQLSAYASIFDVHSTTGEITMAQVLDRDVTGVDEYELVLEIADLGTNHGPRTGTVSLTVCVNDANSDPVFEATSYNISVEECVANHTYILKPNVSDPDRFRFANERLTFAISANGAPYFRVDPYLGWVFTFGQVIDRESPLIDIDFDIEATDSALDPLTAVAQVIVTVIDCNDHAPEFQPLTPTTYAFTIDENSLLNSVVGTIAATDDDEAGNPNSEVEYEIISGDTSVWAVDSDTGQVTVITFPIDREEQETYYLTFKASDKGNPVLTSTREATITLNDLNDNRPTFEYESYTGIVIEGENPPVTITLSPDSILATDPDKGVNSDLTYAINTTFGDGALAAAYLKLDSTTGILTTKVTPNWTITPDFYFEIIARDNGATPLTGTTTVNITVVDRNDHRPVFTDPDAIYHTFIPSFWQNSDGFFETVQATDIDNGINAQITYTITGGNINFWYEVDSVSGNIRVRPGQSVQESSERTELIVTATDAGIIPGPLSSLPPASVFIQVYNAETHLIKITVQAGYDEFFSLEDSFEQEITEAARLTYPDASLQVQWWERGSGTNSNRQKRSTETVDVYIMGTRNQNGLAVGSEGETPQLLTQEELLNMFQRTANGEPVDELQTAGFSDFEVQSVEPYEETNDDVFDDPTGVAIISVSVIFAVVVIVAIALLVWFMFFRQRRAMPSKKAFRSTSKPAGKSETPRSARDYRSKATTPRGNLGDVGVSDDKQFYGGREQLAQKSKAPVVAAVPIPARNVDQGGRVQRQSSLDVTSKQVLQVKPKPAVTGGEAEVKKGVDEDMLSKFDGMAQDPKTGRSYAYNRATNERKWLSSKETEFLKAKFGYKG